MEVPADLPALAGHFPGFPVVPGVIQVGWVLDAVRLLLTGPARLRRIEALKFKELIRPMDIVHLSVEVTADGQRAQFRLWNQTRTISSGRMIFDRNTT